MGAANNGHIYKTFYTLCKSIPFCIPLCAQKKDINTAYV